MDILAAVVVLVIVWHLYAERSWHKERQRLLNAVIAKNAGELAGLDAAQRPKPKPKKDRDVPVEQVGA